MNDHPKIRLAELLSRFIIALVLTIPPNFLAMIAWWITNENGYDARRTPVLGACYMLAGIVSILFVFGFTFKWRTPVIFLLALFAIGAWLGGMLSWRYL